MSTWLLDSYITTSLALIFRGSLGRETILYDPFTIPNTSKKIIQSLMILFEFEELFNTKRYNYRINDEIQNKIYMFSSSFDDVVIRNWSDNNSSSWREVIPVNINHQRNEDNEKRRKNRLYYFEKDIFFKIFLENLFRNLRWKLIITWGGRNNG